MYKENLALNNLQWLICHKTKANQNYKKHIPVVISLWQHKAEVFVKD